ncbi:uncharacterized protein HD556DRAFT_1438955 [Suillus plorans]|uniref:Uncharacterized protein n=1 Tax=Suillus plorans TaxID=116603 RepID=A0A9P7DR54_9AGAM|nr:uncharacterized protein HD556DRAFT_1438955 [Suillus plorans]KAG1800955.1 hypothetical protein HD556DRAFT_1438955 [Suillus plorans]
MDYCKIPTTSFKKACHAFTIEMLETNPRTLREWGRRLDANVKQDLIVEDYPSLEDKAEFDTFQRKWQYLFAYAGAGFAKDYHMLTFTRPNDCPATCD